MLLFVSVIQVLRGEETVSDETGGGIIKTYLDGEYIARTRYDQKLPEIGCSPEQLQLKSAQICKTVLVGDGQKCSVTCKEGFTQSGTSSLVIRKY